MQFVDVGQEMDCMQCCRVLEGSLEYYKAARGEPVCKLGDQRCAATTQQAAFLLMHLKREGRIRNGPFERYASTAMHADHLQLDQQVH